MPRFFFFQFPTVGMQTALSTSCLRPETSEPSWPFELGILQEVDGVPFANRRLSTCQPDTTWGQHPRDLHKRRAGASTPASNRLLDLCKWVIFASTGYSQVLIWSKTLTSSFLVGSVFFGLKTFVPDTDSSEIPRITRVFLALPLGPSTSSSPLKMTRTLRSSLASASPGMYGLVASPFHRRLIHPCKFIGGKNSDIAVFTFKRSLPWAGLADEKYPVFRI